MPERLLRLDDLKTLTSPDGVASLFHRLGYDAEAQPLNLEDLQLTSRSAEAVYDAYLIADQGNGGLQVLLFQLQPEEWSSPSVASSRMKAIASQVGRRDTEFLLLATKDYNQLMLVNPRKSFDDKMNLKASIRKLLIDRTNPTAYDLDRLEAIAVRDKSPQELYKVQCEAFDVEKLTKSFYRGYKQLFDKVQQAVKLHNDHPYFEDSDRLHQFSQRLLGRIMFLYFLQKKEFLAGDRRFLTTQYKHLRPDPDDTEYYTSVLEPLFFQTLNQQRPNLDSKWGKIPYLNGGLFDRDYGPGIRDTAGRPTPETIALPNRLFDPGDMDSILGFFNGYNLTIAENVAGDEDVAVDPEMLGKVFENMLAADERGQSGTFYTPRGIVQFMCSEVLSRYLADETGMSLEVLQKLIDYDPDLPDSEFNQLMTPQQTKSLKQAIASIKVLDPAVGSGAFPLGMMQVILNVRQAVARREGMKVSRGSLTISQWKRDIIANNLYGVDIKPEAIEIAKLRMWLSLVVDIPNIEDVEPLPNLDYKLMCGDSLISTIHGEQLIPDPTKTQQAMLAVTPIQIAIAPLLELEKRYFDVQTEERHRLREQILEAEANVFRVAVSDRLSYWKGKQRELEDKIKLLKGKVSRTQEKERKEIADKLTNLAKFASEVESGERSLNFFQYHLHFRNVFESKGGFDVVIGNPPYIKEYEGKQIFDGLRDQDIYQGKMDIWYLFASKGLDILKNNGLLSFIAQNNWVTSSGASKFRNKILRVAQIETLLDFSNYMIFDTVSIQTMIMLFRKSKENNEYEFDYRRLNGDNLSFEDVLCLMEKINNNQTEFLNPIINRNLLINKSLTFTDNKKTDVLTKISNHQNFWFNSKTEIAQGIVLPQDFVNKASKTKLKTSINVGEGIFCLSNQELKRLSVNKKELDLVKPYFTTKELHRYYGNPDNKLWIIYTDSRYKNPIFLKECSNLKKHLDKFQDVITSDNKPYGLHRSREPHFFTGEKIIASRKCPKEPVFTYTEFDCYVSATFYVIKTDRVNQKYLTGLLNSKLITYWLRHKGKMQGNNFQIDKEPLLNIPIYVPDVKEQDKIIKIVNQILTVKRSNSDSDTSELERKIDKIIYQLYDLTEEEIAIVENAV
ncbi:type II restriction endonuclease (plasmid) [Microcystis aeruginosa NIES-2481]|uniref:Eco57I restriction-modification methylase domain-containing protein n=1 Tax=Microcystis aeruginosa TaxID=1126 RepID=UPI000CA0A879|nr:N-6 DNA methylase [Microcystis aeruginosa]AUS35856.1 type II restriction endonuclease [Microcystis aeruginosa NIES-2481]